MLANWSEIMTSLETEGKGFAEKWNDQGTSEFFLSTIHPELPRQSPKSQEGSQGSGWFGLGFGLGPWVLVQFKFPFSNWKECVKSFKTFCLFSSCLYTINNKKALANWHVVQNVNIHTDGKYISVPIFDFISNNPLCFSDFSFLLTGVGLFVYSVLVFFSFFIKAVHFCAQFDDFGDMQKPMETLTASSC